MNIDDFEQRLLRQTPRQVPAEWREEILSAAEFAAVVHHASPVPRQSWLSAILWPHPAAWAGLAAAWILILAVNVSVRDRSPVVAEKPMPPAPEAIVELRQQRRLLAELMGPRDARDADRSKSFVPQPRSERAELMAA